MPGDGTKLESTANNSTPARLLDLTRTLRRAGRIATGIDRVERAYLRALLADDVPLWALVRTPFGYLLLDPDGLHQAQEQLFGVVPWGPADLLSFLPRNRAPALRQAEAGLRRLARARCVPMRLTEMLRRFLPAGTTYVNVGHSNLTERVLQAAQHANCRIVVMLHDTVPLDFPQFQRDGTGESFRAMLRRVSERAGLLLYNSAATQAQVEAVMKGWRPVPDGLVAHLGYDPVCPDPASLPAGLPPASPYFVCVGTLEPRKNIGFLLDLWEEFGPGAPRLLICGVRGWKNENVFARLDALPPGSPVQEVPGLSDPALASLVQGAAALLFPSLAEGFGLPAVEAAALGTPVLANDLHVFREILGDFSVYANVNDRYLWQGAIIEIARRPAKRTAVSDFDPTSWTDHFKVVLRLI